MRRLPSQGADAGEAAWLPDSGLAECHEPGYPPRTAAATFARPLATDGAGRGRRRAAVG